MARIHGTSFMYMVCILFMLVCICTIYDILYRISDRIILSLVLFVLWTIKNTHTQHTHNKKHASAKRRQPINQTENIIKPSSRSYALGYVGSIYTIHNICTYVCVICGSMVALRARIHSASTEAIEFLGSTTFVFWSPADSIFLGSLPELKRCCQ